MAVQDTSSDLKRPVSDFLLLEGHVYKHINIQKEKPQSSRHHSLSRPASRRWNASQCMCGKDIERGPHPSHFSVCHFKDIFLVRRRGFHPFSRLSFNQTLFFSPCGPAENKLSMKEWRKSVLHKLVCRTCAGLLKASGLVYNTHTNMFRFSEDNL